MWITTLLLPLSVIIATASSQDEGCMVIEDAFRAAINGETPSCHCYDDGFYADVKGITISCNNLNKWKNTRREWEIFNQTRIQKIINKTGVGLLTLENITVYTDIWRLPPEFRPQKLKIENTQMTGTIRVLNKVPEKLEEFSLKSQKVTADKIRFIANMKKLKKLELSNNEIAKIERSTFAPLSSLEVLDLSDNPIMEVEAGAFDNMRKLRKLILDFNKIPITKDLFKGLESLEELYIIHNSIQNESAIDWSAFRGLQNLRVLDLTDNYITKGQIHGLERLEKLVLADNPIESLKDFTLKDLPSLIHLSLDGTLITEIGNSDLSGLTKSTRLETFTMAYGKLAKIAPRALVPIQSISTLVIENSPALSTLNIDGESVLKPLKRLTTFIASWNGITEIHAGDLPSSLQELMLDNNAIVKIHPGALNKLELVRLHLNNNFLNSLPEGSFDSMSIDTLKTIDIRENKYICTAEDYWLYKFLMDASHQDIGDGVLGCLAVDPTKRKGIVMPTQEEWDRVNKVINDRQKTQQETEQTTSEEKKESNTAWAVAATIIAPLCFLLLVLIAYMFVSEGGKEGAVYLRSLTSGRSTSSDTQKLIQDSDFLVSKEFLDSSLRRTTSSDKKKVRFEESPSLA